MGRKPLTFGGFIAVSFDENGERHERRFETFTEEEQLDIRKRFTDNLAAAFGYRPMTDKEIREYAKAEKL